MRKGNRARRPKLATEVPLDDGPREGTDAWRTIDELRFCHWDRWLLLLSLEEPEGLASIGREFRRRARAERRDRDVAEAMLAQLSDLGARLAVLGRAAGDVLEPVERQSTWLRDKAFRRVWHATSIRRTDAMLRTPRNLLETRARDGTWTGFPVSPSPYFVRLQAIYRGGYFDYRGVGLVVLQLDLEGNHMLAAASSDDERLAIRRAILGACVEAMAHVDDSGDELGDHFRNQEHAYLAGLLTYAERPSILRDLLELATWEDYGLFRHIEGFLATLPEAAADLAIRALARIIAELRGADLDYQMEKARRLRGFVIKSAAIVDRCPDPAVGAP